MSRILISEFMDDRAVARLSAAHEVIYDPQLVDDAAQLHVQVEAADALIVRNRTQVRGALLQALGRCRVVGRLGVGLDNIDVAGCRARGIDVIPATGANAISVAEYVIAAALTLRRGVFASTAAVAAGQWPRVALSGGLEIAGAVLGLIGYGTIGRLTAARARALGMQVLAFDDAVGPDDPAFGDNTAHWAPLSTVLRSADVLSLHVPLSDSTRGLLNAQRLQSLKPGAVVINTSRGGIVDEQALAQCLRSGHLGGAALDVFEQEPLGACVHFEGCPNLVLTPHIAGVTAQSNERVSELIAQRVLQALDRPRRP